MKNQFNFGWRLTLLVFCIRCCCFNFLKRYSSLQVSGGCVSSNPSSSVKKWVNYRLLLFSKAQGEPSQLLSLVISHFQLLAPDQLDPQDQTFVFNTIICVHNLKIIVESMELPLPIWNYRFWLVSFVSPCSVVAEVTVL